MMPRCRERQAPSWNTKEKALGMLVVAKAKAAGGGISKCSYTMLEATCNRSRINGAPSHWIRLLEASLCDSQQK